MASIWLQSGTFWTVAHRITRSGEPVNDYTALSIATCFTACRVLADGIATLPCRVYRQTPNGKMEDFDNPLGHLLQIAPNE